MSSHRQFTRQELHDLVWTTPIVKLAREFGLSDVGFRKTCIRHQVPTPPLGYWAKRDAGKPVRKIPLPPPGPGVSDRVMVSVFTLAEVLQDVAEAEARARERITPPIFVSNDTPARIHPAAMALNKALRKAKQDPEGFLEVCGAGVLSASVGPANRARVQLIVNTLFKAIEAAGQPIRPTEAGLVVLVDGESLDIRIGESRDRKAHDPTRSELKAEAEWEANRLKWPSLYSRDRQHWRSWDHYPSGRLTLTLIDPLRSRWQDGYLLGRWSDRKNSKLESCLGEVLVRMLTGAATARHHRIAAEIAERERQEAHEASQKEQRRRRYEAQVDAFIEGKADELVRLQKIIGFRDYIASRSVDPCSPQEEAILYAAEDLIRRLQHGLSGEILRSAVRLIDD
jgi:hypothetical protein